MDRAYHTCEGDGIRFVVGRCLGHQALRGHRVLKSGKRCGGFQQNAVRRRERVPYLYAFHRGLSTQKFTRSRFKLKLNTRPTTDSYLYSIP